MTPLEQAIRDAARQAIDAISDGWGDAEDAVARGEITPALRALVVAALAAAAEVAARELRDNWDAESETCHAVEWEIRALLPQEPQKP